jgi:hypothetical protein
MLENLKKCSQMAILRKARAHTELSSQLLLLLDDNDNYETVVQKWFLLSHLCGGVKNITF